ncbi:hypothetical protein HII36_07235 [Nonomuraea sp. NN258]|uniref:hypothetical protein n=1 Tax=Nonomuraea antri TaxID=2730852 RepID=UPI00156A35AF|nr:hypothetical protein [Nonomuraea antri]NRQ31634.1 hypothetical protein [Nonomuraea antri]
MSDARKSAARAQVAAAAANLAAALKELREAEPELVENYEAAEVLAHEAQQSWSVSYTTSRPEDVDY